jgi:hypothetical protein
MVVCTVSGCLGRLPVELLQPELVVLAHANILDFPSTVFFA